MFTKDKSKVTYTIRLVEASVITFVDESDWEVRFTKSLKNICESIIITKEEM
jgi:hypothetical protein